MNLYINVYIYEEREKERGCLHDCTLADNSLEKYKEL